MKLMNSSFLFQRQGRHGKRRLFKPVKEPLKQSRSTLPLTPGTLPTSVYCQKLQVLQAGGTYGVGLLT